MWNFVTVGKESAAHAFFFFFVPVCLSLLKCHCLKVGFLFQVTSECSTSRWLQWRLLSPCSEFPFWVKEKT